MDKVETIAAIVLPFANEIASVLTSSHVKFRGHESFSNLYAAVQKTKMQKFSHIVIDFIALSGIILNAVRTAEKHGKMAGLVKGVGVLLIAFIIPTLTMHAFMDNVCRRCSPKMKIFIGLLLIATLTGFEYLFEHFIVEVFFAKEHTVEASVDESGH